MKGISRMSGTVLLAAAAGWMAAALGGCQAHPDYQGAVYQALGQHDMASVEVFENRDRGVITLKGIVGSASGKAQAAQLVEKAAPGYQVDNQLTVDAVGIMSMANPHAAAPQVQQMAHAPEVGGNSRKPEAAHRR